MVWEQLELFVLLDAQVKKCTKWSFKGVVPSLGQVKEI